MTATASRPSNGHVAPTAVPPADDSKLPVDSFREAAPLLRRPFTPAAVKFKVQATWPKDTPTGGLIVAYIDARLVTERLNMVCPHLWEDAYNGPMCRLTIDGLTRHDVGDGTGKALVSDAFKRAAVKFGVGVSLYAIPSMRLNKSNGHLEDRRTRDGMSLVLTPNGETHVRMIYEGWLDMKGRQAFGDPLDHGDSEDAQGDAEVDAAPDPVDTAPAAVVQRATDEQVDQIKDAIRGLTNAKIRLAFGAVGLDAASIALADVPREKVAELVKRASEIER
jgi:hypothetical protein